jgi:hypothetical protein
LKVKVSQTQRIDQFNPAYAFELPIDLKLPGNARETVTMRVDAKDQESSFTLRAKPVDVVFDPRLSIAAPTAVRKPLAMWMEQLGHESVFAQLDAIDELGKRVAQDDPDRAAILAALTRIAADPNAPDVLRDSAAVRVAGGVWTGARAWLAETLMGMPRIALAR